MIPEGNSLRMEGNIQGVLGFLSWFLSPCQVTEACLVSELWWLESGALEHTAQHSGLCSVPPVQPLLLGLAHVSVVSSESSTFFCVRETSGLLSG